jgi:hypothetical protein
MAREGMTAAVWYLVLVGAASGCGKKKGASGEAPPGGATQEAVGDRCAGKYEVAQPSWGEGECSAFDVKRTFFVIAGDDGKYIVTTQHGLLASQEQETAKGCRLQIQESSSFRDETTTVTYQLVVTGDQVTIDGRLEEEKNDIETGEPNDCSRTFTAKVTRSPLLAKDISVDNDAVKDAFAHLWKGEGVVHASEECTFPALATAKPVAGAVKVEVSAAGRLGRLWIDGQDQGTFDERCTVSDSASEELIAPNPSGRDAVATFTFEFPGSGTGAAAGAAMPPPRAALSAPPAALSKLLGEHKMSLQYIGTRRLGIATVTDRDGVLELHGRQERGEGDTEGEPTDFVSIDGVITDVSDNEFKFRGTIVTRVSYIASGRDCRRDGEYSFAIKGKRRYWRLQQMDNPCDTSTDYVDIYLR